MERRGVTLGRWDVALVRAAAWAWLGVACLLLWAPASAADGPEGRETRWGLLGYRQVTARPAGPALVHRDGAAAAATAFLTVALAAAAVTGLRALDRGPHDRGGQASSLAWVERVRELDRPVILKPAG